MQKKKLYKPILFILVGLTAVLNFLALNRGFRNFYSDKLYVHINGIIGRLTSPVPVAVGEIIMYVVAALAFLWIVLLLIFLFMQKKTSYRHFVTDFSRRMLLLFVFTIFVYTVNWFIPFRSDLIKVSDNERTEFSFDELAMVYTEIVENMNELATLVPRDENGSIIYDYSTEDIAGAMANLCDVYPRLKGHYSEPKEAMCSAFLDWMNIGGYNYIYTMEPTYNRYVNELYKPALLAHEYAHHKGYYKENEGEFLGCISLVSQDNPLLKYSGYYEMFRFVSDEFNKKFADIFVSSYGELSMDTIDLYKELRARYPEVSKQVVQDIDESYRRAEALYESEVSSKLEETFSETTGKIADKGWEIQGEVLKENTYDGLTLMLLQYYIDE